MGGGVVLWDFSFDKSGNDHSTIFLPLFNLRLPRIDILIGRFSIRAVFISRVEWERRDRWEKLGRAARKLSPLSFSTAIVRWRSGSSGENNLVETPQLCSAIPVEI